MKNNKQRFALFFGTVLLATWGGVYAESDPDNIIKYRRNVMKALGGHMGATAQIVRGKVAYGDHLAFHAESIEAISRRVGEMFPEDSDFGETKAKEAIWEKPDEFEEAVEKAEMAAAAYLAAAGGSDQAAIGTAFRSLSDACKGCHKKFREKDD